MNTEKLNRVATEAKAKAAGNIRWTRAIEKAQRMLESGELVVSLLATDALVTSPNGSYRVNGHCSCLAAQRGHGECYHRAGKRLVELMEATSGSKDLEVRAALESAIQTTWPRLETVDLADALMSRFGVNNLRMLSTSLLHDILNVLA